MIEAGRVSRGWRAAVDLPAAALGEALGSGALPSRIRPLLSCRHLCGPALPVVTAPGDNLWLHRALARADADEVLVVDTGGDRERGYWGELMTRGAVVRRLGGLVLDGGIRDRHELEALAWPVFATGFCLRGTSKSPQAPGSVGTPIRLGEVTVYRGDLVVGDGDGVVVVPRRRVAAVVVAARRRVTAERRAVEAVGQGMSLHEALGLSLKEAGTKRRTP